MHQQILLNKKHWKTGLYSLFAFIFVISLINYPETALNSSLRSINIWWNVVFPSLFPFFIVSELLIGFGVVHFMSVLLEPLMRPVFNLPGSGAFVMTMGFASGYPMSAKLTAKLREQELVNQYEGERLVCFTTTSDPLFMFGAIAVGFFHDPTIGIMLVVIHYLAALLLGVGMRYYERNRPISKPLTQSGKGMILVRALQAMHRARLKDNRPLGKLLGDAVMSAFHTLALIGGFMMLMAVILALLQATNVSAWIISCINWLLPLFGISTELSPALMTGIFEVTLGSQEASLAANALISEKIFIVAMILAWSGLSVHAQIAAILSTTDIRYKPFFFSRIIHAILCGALTLLLWKPLTAFLQFQASPAYSNHTPNSPWQINLTEYIGAMFAIHFGLWIIILLAGIAAHMFKKFFRDKFF